jgi:hypothetical protein
LTQGIDFNLGVKSALSLVANVLGRIERDSVGVVGVLTPVESFLSASHHCQLCSFSARDDRLVEDLCPVSIERRLLSIANRLISVINGLFAVANGLFQVDNPLRTVGFIFRAWVNVL